MKYGEPLGTILGPVMFIIYTLTLQYMLKYYDVSYYFYADDTHIYFKLEIKDSNGFLKIRQTLFKDCFIRSARTIIAEFISDQVTIHLLSDNSSIKSGRKTSVKIWNGTVALSLKLRICV